MPQKCWIKFKEKILPKKFLFGCTLAQGMFFVALLLIFLGSFVATGMIYLFKKNDYYTEDRWDYCVEEATEYSTNPVPPPTPYNLLLRKNDNPTHVEKDKTAKEYRDRKIPDGMVIAYTVTVLLIMGIILDIFLLFALIMHWTEYVYIWKYAFMGRGVTYVVLGIIIIIRCRKNTFRLCYVLEPLAIMWTAGIGLYMYVPIALCSLLIYMREHRELDNKPPKIHLRKRIKEKKKKRGSKVPEEQGDGDKPGSRRSSQQSRASGDFEWKPPPKKRRMSKPRTSAEGDTIPSAQEDHKISDSEPEAEPKRKVGKRRSPRDSPSTTPSRSKEEPEAKEEAPRGPKTGTTLPESKPVSQKRATSLETKPSVKGGDKELVRKADPKEPGRPIPERESHATQSPTLAPKESPRERTSARNTSQPRSAQSSKRAAGTQTPRIKRPPEGSTSGAKKPADSRRSLVREGSTTVVSDLSSSMARAVEQGMEIEKLREEERKKRERERLAGMEKEKRAVRPRTEEELQMNAYKRHEYEKQRREQEMYKRQQEGNRRLQEQQQQQRRAQDIYKRQLEGSRRLQGQQQRSEQEIYKQQQEGSRRLPEKQQRREQEIYKRQQEGSRQLQEQQQRSEQEIYKRQQEGSRRLPEKQQRREQEIYKRQQEGSRRLPEKQQRREQEIYKRQQEGSRQLQEQQQRSKKERSQQPQGENKPQGTEHQRRQQEPKNLQQPYRLQTPQKQQIIPDRRDDETWSKLKQTKPEASRTIIKTYDQEKGYGTKPSPMSIGRQPSSVTRQPTRGGTIRSGSERTLGSKVSQTLSRDIDERESKSQKSRSSERSSRPDRLTGSGRSRSIREARGGR